MHEVPSRTVVSVVATMAMVVLTVLLAAWSTPASEQPVRTTAHHAPIVIGAR